MEVRKYFETYENKNTTFQNVRDSFKVVLRMQL